MNLFKIHLLSITKDLLAWLCYCFIGKVIILVNLKTAVAFARIIGRTTAWSYPLGYRYQRMLAKLLPDVAPNQGREFCAQLPILFCERLKGFRLGKLAALEKIIAWEGEAFLEDALAQKRGAILIGAHFGACNLGLNYLGLRGYPLNLYRTAPKQPGNGLTAGIQRQIEKLRMRIFDDSAVNSFFYQPGTNPLFPLLKMLSHGEIVVILPDGGMSREFHEAPFLSGHLQLATGFAHLAQLTGAPIIPFFCVREKNKYRAVCERPYYVGKADGEDIHSAINHFSRILERYFRNYPAQWNLLAKMQLRDHIDADWLLLNPGALNRSNTSSSPDV